MSALAAREVAPGGSKLVKKRAGTDTKADRYRCTNTEEKNYTSEAAHLIPFFFSFFLFSFGNGNHEALGRQWKEGRRLYQGPSARLPPPSREVGEMAMRGQEGGDRWEGVEGGREAGTSRGQDDVCIIVWEYRRVEECVNIEIGEHIGEENEGGRQGERQEVGGQQGCEMENMI